MSRFGNPDFSWLESVDDHHSVGKRLLSEGKSFYDVRLHLAEAGVRDHNIESIISGLASDFADRWMADGTPESQIIQWLVKQDLSAEQAYAAFDKALQKQTRREQPLPRINHGDWQYFAGFGLMLVGVFLWGGNSFGFFRTISGLGWMTILAGSSIAGYQYYKENR
jgi:hypothetical protein